MSLKDKRLGGDFFKIKCKKGCRCEKAGGQKFCGSERKAGKERCSVDMEIRRQDYNQARCEANVRFQDGDLFHGIVNLGEK